MGEGGAPNLHTRSTPGPEGDKGVDKDDLQVGKEGVAYAAGLLCVCVDVYVVYTCLYTQNTILKRQAETPCAETCGNDMQRAVWA